MPETGLPLATPRLVLRRFVATDGAGLHAYLSRPEAVAFEPYPVQSREACDLEARRRSGDQDFLAVCRADTGELVGNLYFHPEDPEAWRTSELGYVFHPDHWGRGYATEAVRGLLDLAFGQWGVRRVTARCNPDNAASWRLLERVGFRREGHLLAAVSFVDDEHGNPLWHDTYLYALLASEWESAG